MEPSPADGRPARGQDEANVWDFLLAEKFDGAPINASSMELDTINLDDYLIPGDDHELSTHAPFFSEQSNSLDRHMLNDAERQKDHHGDDNVGTLPDILFQSAGLSALLPTIDALGIEPFATDESKDRAQPWEPLLEELESQLIQIYFQTMQTLCPVLDELDFYQWYQNRIAGKDFFSLRNLVFHAVIFAAFAHVDEKQLEQSPYSSVTEGQQDLFEHVHYLYKSLRDANQGTVELIQCACILSHWSPNDSSKEVNYFWADEALNLALLAGLHESRRPYHRVIWWCGLQRNRALTLALRRPHKLKQVSPGRLPIVTDFGSARVYNRSFKGPKIYAADLFMSLCKLSVIMNEIILLRYHTSRWDDWRGDRASGMVGQSTLDRIMEIDRALNEWNTVFERGIRDFDETNVPRRTRVSAHVLRMMAQSTKASLYEHYLEASPSDNSLNWLLSTVALSKVKEVSFDVASQTRNILSDSEPQDIPLNIYAWLMLPITYFLVQVKVQGESRRPEVVSSLEVMLHFGSTMSSRFTGIGRSSDAIIAMAKHFDRIMRDSDHHDKDLLTWELLRQGRRILWEGMAFGIVERI